MMYFNKNEIEYSLRIKRNKVEKCRYNMIMCVQGQG